MLIYEVNIVLDVEKATDFEAWLPGHMEELLETGCFSSAHWYLGEPQAPTQTTENKTTYVVHYHCENRANLDRYFNEFAAKLRGDGAERFADAMTITRRTLTAQ